MKADKTGRAGCVDSDAGALEIEEVGNSVGEDGLAVAGCLVQWTTLRVATHYVCVVFVEDADVDGCFGAGCLLN